MSLILLIDDDEDMLAITGRWLEKAGYEVSKTASGKDALSFLSDRKPDLILLDYAMPEMDGPTVLRQIRANDTLKNIPVLYRTGMDDTVFGDGSDQIKADGVVPKSEGKPSLLKAIERALV
ncbi:MAG: response regulator [Lachnospiraceae bacterium]|nr:response regulator [Lachnospiraceae bacterium]